MKKIIFVLGILFLISVFIIGGCSVSDDVSDNDQINQEMGLDDINDELDNIELDNSDLDLGDLDNLDEDLGDL